MINLSFVLISDNHTCISKCANNPAWKTLIIFILRSRFRMDAKAPTLRAQKRSKKLIAFCVSTHKLHSCTNGFLRCTQIIHENKLFSAHISKNSTTGCFAPCAETPNLDQYIPPTHIKLKIKSTLKFWFAGAVCSCEGYVCVNNAESLSYM